MWNLSDDFAESVAGQARGNDVPGGFHRSRRRAGGDRCIGPGQHGCGVQPGGGEWFDRRPRPGAQCGQVQAVAARGAALPCLSRAAGYHLHDGGIAIDAHARVVTGTGTPVAHLYAVGCASGGLEGGTRHGYVGGLVKSGVTGLRAAEHILGIPA